MDRQHLPIVVPLMIHLLLVQLAHGKVPIEMEGEQLKFVKSPLDVRAFSYLVPSIDGD